jgi:hypothetical protein
MRSVTRRENEQTCSGAAHIISIRKNSLAGQCGIVRRVYRGAAFIACHSSLAALCRRALSSCFVVVLRRRASSSVYSRYSIGMPAPRFAKQSAELPAFPPQQVVRQSWDNVRKEAGRVRPSCHGTQSCGCLFEFRHGNLVKSALKRSRASGLTAL